VRPIALANGRRELAEVFFDEVAVSEGRRIGEEGRGWAVAMYLLQWERSMYAWQCSVMLFARLAELRNALRSDGASAAVAASGRLGTVYLDLLELRARSLGTLNRLARGRPVGPEASIDKVLLARAEHGLHDAARDLRPDAFLLDPTHARHRGEWWYSRSASILGGSAELQRGTIADRLLGLPQEPRHG
jgi:alkylation response protein AidB-like acyl-CoA dehydrogenase